MELGTGIFLSAILVSTVLLYGYTRDRWNWKKIFGYPFLVLVISSLGGGLYYYYEEIMPRPVTELEGIALGMTYGDVVFQKGKPTEEVTDEDDGDVTLKYSGLQVTVDGQSERVKSIWVWGDDCWKVKVRNASACDKVDDLIDTFGEPSNINTGKDGLLRVYTFSKYNISFALQQNEVELIAIFDPAEQNAGVTIKSDEE